MNVNQDAANATILKTRTTWRDRFGHTFLPDSPYMIGVPEVVGAAFAVLLFAFAAVSYFYLLVPARTQHAELIDERTRSQALLNSSSDGADGAGQAASPAEIIDSLRRFEAEHLPAQTEGQTRLIVELNEIVRRNNVRNPKLDFTTLEAIDAAGGSNVVRRSEAAQLQAVYPGIGVQLSVEGDYQNLRRLIRDIESSTQFVVVNGIEFEDVTTQSGTGGSVVGLQLNLATYFRPHAARTTNTETSAVRPNITAQ